MAREVSNVARKNDGLVAAVIAGLGLAFLFSLARTKKDGAREEIAKVAQGALRRVAEVLGIREPPLFLVDGGSRNAWSDGHQLGINLQWIDAEISETCDSVECALAVVLGVLGHELGHHHHGDAFSGDQHVCGLNHGRELRADRIAGWVLGKVGADRRDFERVMAKSSWSCTHPPGPARVAAIEAGYVASTQGTHWTVL